MKSKARVGKVQDAAVSMDEVASEEDASTVQASKRARLGADDSNTAVDKAVVEATAAVSIAPVAMDNQPAAVSVTAAEVEPAIAAAVEPVTAATAVTEEEANGDEGAADAETAECWESMEVPEEHRQMAAFAAKALQQFALPEFGACAGFAADAVPPRSKNRSVIYDFGLKASNSSDGRCAWFCLCTEQCLERSRQGNFISIKGSAANCTVHLRERHGILGLRSRKFLIKRTSFGGVGSSSIDAFNNSSGDIKDIEFSCSSGRGSLLRSPAAMIAAMNSLSNRASSSNIASNDGNGSSNSSSSSSSDGASGRMRSDSIGAAAALMPPHLSVELAQHWAEYFAQHKQQKYQLLAGPRMETIAKDLMQRQPSRFLYHETNWEKFPDGTDRITIGGFQPTNMISGQHVLLLASFHNNDVTLSQFSVMVALLQSFVESLTVVLPFYPVGTMERVVREGQVATANTYAQMFSNLPTCGKPTRLVVYDLHTLQNRFYLHGNAIASLQTTVPLLVQRLRSSPQYAHVDCIAFPDDGAAKRFGAMFAGLGFQIVTCGKTRGGSDSNSSSSSNSNIINNCDRRVVSIQDGDPAGRSVVIVDDLVQTGGTLYECGLALKAAGAAEVSAFVAHAVFPRNAWKEFAKGGSRSAVFKKFFVSNSIPTVVSALPKNDVFEVLDIAAKIIQDLDKYS